MARPSPLAQMRVRGSGRASFPSDQSFRPRVEEMQRSGRKPVGSGAGHLDPRCRAADLRRQPKPKPNTGTGLTKGVPQTNQARDPETISSPGRATGELRRTALAVGFSVINAIEKESCSGWKRRGSSADGVLDRGDRRRNEAPRGEVLVVLAGGGRCRDRQLYVTARRPEGDEENEV